MIETKENLQILIDEAEQIVSRHEGIHRVHAILGGKNNCAGNKTGS